MKYMKLHKSKAGKNEHAFSAEGKRTSSNGQKVKRLSDATQKLLTMYKNPQRDSSRDALWTYHQAEDEARKESTR
ncbi:hypothetical protein Tco_0705511 [Tanacetum coccineum]|uniref:Uncharacterized protein n=1 Tax=Tanacetum coccineum TaxID=301880 RepID=A0ABQ4Y6Q9_9ASTR